MNEYEQAFLDSIVEHEDPERLNAIVAEHFQNPQSWPGTDLKHGTLIVPVVPNPYWGFPEEYSSREVINAIAKFAPKSHPTTQAVLTYAQDVLSQRGNPIDPFVFEIYVSIDSLSRHRAGFTFSSEEQGAVYDVLDRTIPSGWEDDDASLFVGSVLFTAGLMRPVLEEQLTNTVGSSLETGYRWWGVSALRNAHLFDHAYDALDRIEIVDPPYPSTHRNEGESLADKLEYERDLITLHREQVEQKPRST